MVANATADADQAAAATRTAQRDTASSTDFVTTGAEHMSDIGQSESWTSFNLEIARRDRHHFDMAAFAAQSHQSDMHVQALRLARNGEGNDKQSTQQIQRHNDLAVDRIWNPDEVAQMTTIVTAILAKMAENN